MRYYTQILPQKVADELPVICALLRPRIPGFAVDCLKEIISIVATHRMKDEEATPLQMKYIKQLIPQGEKYLAGLVDLGIIKRSGKYIPGITSYRYCFSKDYESKYVAIPLNNVRLIWRIEMIQARIRKDAERRMRGYINQTKYLRKLTLDDGYERFIKTKYEGETDKYNCLIASAIRIINRDFFYSVDSTSRRFHSNVTNMSKELRPFLRIDGEPLINIDVKNSQPYLSTIILTDPSKVSWLTENTAFALLLQTLKVSVKQDVINYISLVVSGQLYEYLMSEFAREALHLTRDETKLQVLRILFSRNRNPGDEINRKARMIFKDRFPTVHRIFSKVRGSQAGDKFSNFKRFAILLQRIESYLMLDMILKRVYRELPGTIAITIHDSVMTGILTNNVEAVKKIMNEEFTFFIGFAPKIKIERIEDNEEENITIEQYDSTAFVTLN